MDLNNYEPTAAPIDQTPRPRASQDVAARKRARQDDDPELTTPAQRSHRTLLGAGAALLIILMIGAAAYQLAKLPSARPLQITPEPAQAFQKQPQEAAPAPTSEAIAPERTVDAYAAPDGLLLGQIETTREIIPVAHYGSAWVAYQDGAGLVWVRAADAPGVALTGPDLAPARGPTVSNDPPAVAPEPSKGTKPAPDRAARYATAVARDRETHGQKGP